MGPSHGVTCFSQGAVSVSSSDHQGVGSRGSHRAVKQSPGYFCFTQPGWRGTAVGAVPKAGSVVKGQLHPSSLCLRRGGPRALPALPSHSPGLRCPPAPAGTSQLSQEALGCAGTEQAVGRGAMGEMSVVLPAVSSFALYSTTQNHQG